MTIPAKWIIGQPRQADYLVLNCMKESSEQDEIINDSSEGPIMEENE